MIRQALLTRLLPALWLGGLCLLQLLVLCLGHQCKKHQEEGGFGPAMRPAAP